MSKARLLFDGTQAAYIAMLTGALKAPPMFVADAFGVSPIRIGKLLESRGQYDPSAEGSLIDAIRAHYGDFAAQMCLESTVPKGMDAKKETKEDE